MLKPEVFKQSMQAIDAFGANPTMLVKVAKLANDPDTDTATVCDLLRNDGPLAAGIIRISNSPYYAPVVPHGNLSSAVSQIGMRELIRVVNLHQAQHLFAHDLPGYGIAALDHWKASLAAALVMEASAKLSGLDSEDAFTIGILHAIGRVLINHVVRKRNSIPPWDGHQPVEEWERNAVGFDYAEAGAMLLEHWHFPPATCKIILWQLNPEPTIEPLSMQGSLQFAKRLLAVTGVDFAGDAGRLPMTDPYVGAAGLNPEQVAQLVADCRREFLRVLKAAV